MSNEQDIELPDVSSRAHKEIQVVVIGATKAGNGPCLIRFEVCCTAGQYANGDHYDAALDEAAKHGWELPIQAIDENDPAWKDIVPATADTVLYRVNIYHKPLDPRLKEIYAALNVPLPPESDEEDYHRWLTDHYSQIAAIYWYSNLNHAGQWSNLYSVLSTSLYTPGRAMQGPESEGELCVEAYNKLCDAFGGDYVELDLEIHEDEYDDEDTTWPGHVTVIVVGIQGEAGPDMEKYVVNCTKGQYELGDHLDAGLRAAKEDGYEAGTFCFDEDERAFQYIEAGMPISRYIDIPAEPGMTPAEEGLAEALDDHYDSVISISSGNQDDDTVEDGLSALARDLNEFRTAFNSIVTGGGHDFLLRTKLEEITNGAIGLAEVWEVQRQQASPNTKLIRNEHPDDDALIDAVYDLPYFKQGPGERNKVLDGIPAALIDAALKTLEEGAKHNINSVDLFNTVQGYRDTIYNLIEALKERNEEAHAETLAELKESKQQYQDLQNYIAAVCDMIPSQQGLLAVRVAALNDTVESAMHVATELTKRVHAAIEQLRKIVCTKGEDTGVVLLSSDSPTHVEEVDGKPATVYDLPYFSELGGALFELHQTLTTTSPDKRERAETIEQLVRDMLAAAVKDGLVSYIGDDSFTAGDLIMPAQLLSDWLRTRRQLPHDSKDTVLVDRVDMKLLTEQVALMHEIQKSLESTPIITARHHAALEGVLKILDTLVGSAKVSTGNPTCTKDKGDGLVYICDDEGCPVHGERNKLLSKAFPLETTPSHDDFLLPATIDTVINHLNAIRKTHGNIDVVVYEDNQIGDCSAYIGDITFYDGTAAIHLNGAGIDPRPSPKEGAGASQTNRFIIQTDHHTPLYLVDWLMTQGVWKWSNRKQDAFKFQDPTKIRAVLKQLRDAGFKVITTPVQE